uniref:Uncharacterized protein n=1 Tax=Pelusios castaneus TaxID=367368 RepID=A0A8C8RPF0_9SAUR
MASGRGSQLGAAGLCLSCLATVLLAVSAATEYWIRLWVLGIVIHQGLWRECQLGSCAPLHSQPGRDTGSPYSEPIVRRPGRSISESSPQPHISCLAGALAGTALVCFMGGSTGETGSRWAWSLAVGWAAVPAAGLAGEHTEGARTGAHGDASFLYAEQPHLFQVSAIARLGGGSNTCTAVLEDGLVQG